MNNATNTKIDRTFENFQMFLFTLHRPLWGFTAANAIECAAEYHTKAVRK